VQKQIIIINGTGGSGKDTFVEFCMKYGSVMNFSSIDKVKDVARVVGWNGQKTEKDRKFLSDLKRLTTEYNDMAFNSLRDAVNQFQISDYDILFIHIREPEEIERAANFFNAKTLLVKRLGLSNIESNASDANVDNYPYDYEIMNTTLEELDKSAQGFISALKSDVSKKLIVDHNDNDN